MQDQPGKSGLTAILDREEDKILACVHCGLCLEACPTYVATGDENDGPRGRIYLMRAVEEGRLSVESPSFERHIDRCLGCRACEAVCPAGVEYGQLLEAARGELTQARVKSGIVYSLLGFVLRHVWLQPKRLSAAFTFARFLRDQGVASFLLKTKIAWAISSRFEFALLLVESSKDCQIRESLLKAGKMPANRRQDVGAPANGRERITLRIDQTKESQKIALLFKGCVTEGLFQRVNEATARVLEVNETITRVPLAQVCCGALHAHAGDLAGARRLARQNIDAFAAESDENAAAPIVTNAGGCGAMLVSYGQLLAGDQNYADRAREFSARVRDIGQHLQAAGFRNGAAIGHHRTTYDASCHLLHGQHGADASLKMLWAIPELNFVLLKDSDVCCGGAGVYNLLEPELSEQVLDEKLKQIEATGAEVLATGNPGCHMQIGAGARLAGMNLRVGHPVELLDESYRRAGFYDD